MALSLEGGDPAKVLDRIHIPADLRQEISERLTAYFFLLSPTPASIRLSSPRARISWCGRSHTGNGRGRTAGDRYKAAATKKANPKQATGRADDACGRWKPRIATSPAEHGPSFAKCCACSTTIDETAQSPRTNRGDRRGARWRAFGGSLSGFVAILGFTTAGIVGAALACFGLAFLVAAGFVSVSRGSTAAVAGVTLANTMKSSPSERIAELTLVSATMSEEPAVNRSEISWRRSAGIWMRSSTLAGSPPSRLIAIQRASPLSGANPNAVKTCVPRLRSGSRNAIGASRTRRKSCLTNRCPAGGSGLPATAWTFFASSAEKAPVSRRPFAFWNALMAVCVSSPSRPENSAA